MTARLSLREDQAGFTLIEMIVVGALVMVGAAVAIPVTQQMVANAKGDSALVMTSSFLESARNRAVAERRNIELAFIAPNRMQLIRIEVPSGTRTTIAEMMLEGNEEFVRISGHPDTPDAYGGVGAVNFSGTEPVMFTSDGSLIDSAGDVTNGTLFVARPGAPDTARAVTISGVTGMLRSWNWRGSQWLQ